MKPWLIVFAIAMAALALGFQAGAYQPKPGETVILLDIEGKGEVVIKLETQKAPKASAHVINLANQGFYNGLKFHRVVTEPRPFLVQVGDANSRTMSLDKLPADAKGTGAKIPFEDTGLTNAEGAVGLAAPIDDRNAGDSQFYINLAANRFLDGSYTVFGQVVRGMDVVKRIRLGDQVRSATVKRG